MRKPMEVYLSDLEWTKTHNNMGGVMGKLIFKDNMSYEEYQELFKTTYFVLCDKDYITNLQKENEYLKLNNPEMNIEHFRIINENKRKIDNLRKQNKELLKKSYSDDVRITKAVELLKNKKEKYKNMTDYHQYYVEGYDKAIELTHSSHSGIMLETIRSATIKNCDDLLNILDDGSDSE